MMNTLLLNTTDGSYYQFDANKRLETIDVSDSLGSKNIFIIDSVVNIVSVSMPLKQDKQIERALPFAIEESISSDLEQTHIKYLGKKSGDAYGLIADKTFISAFHQDEQVLAVSYLPVFLPETINGMTVILINDTALVNVSQFKAFSIPVALLEHSLASIIQSDESLTSISVLDATPGKEGKFDDLLMAQLQSLQVEIKPLNPESFYQGIDNADLKKSSLFSGEFKRVQQKNSAQLSKFRSVSVFFFALLVLALLMSYTYIAQTENKADAVQQASIEFYKKLFPNERVRKKLMKRQFNDYIKNASGVGRSEGNFTSLLGRTGSEIKTFKSIKIESAKFNEKNQLLEVSLICDSVNQLDQLKQKLISKGLQVDIASANQAGGAIKGVIKVKANG
jgi:general secretion pathway protein L